MAESQNIDVVEISMEFRPNAPLANATSGLFKRGLSLADRARERQSLTLHSERRFVVDAGWFYTANKGNEALVTAQKAFRQQLLGRKLIVINPSTLHTIPDSNDTSPFGVRAFSLATPRQDAQPGQFWDNVEAVHSVLDQVLVPRLDAQSADDRAYRGFRLEVPERVLPHEGELEERMSGFREAKDMFTIEPTKLSVRGLTFNRSTLRPSRLETFR